MTNHKAEAERNIDGLHDYQSEEGMTDESMLTVAIEAQAHATLYLAEQQRIANLIAYAADKRDRDKFADLTGIAVDIKLGLGL